MAESSFHPGKTVREVALGIARSLPDDLWSDCGYGATTRTVVTVDLAGGGPGWDLEFWFDQAEPGPDAEPLEAFLNYYEAAGTERIRFPASEAEVFWRKLNEPID